MTIDPNQCTVFVQVWVDINALQQGSTNGCYVVSNRSQHSSGEGTASVAIAAIANSDVCWSVIPIDPQYNGDFTITQIGDKTGWSPPPAPVQDKPNVFTGKLTKSAVDGDINSNIQFSYSGAGGIKMTLPLTITPISAES